MLLHFAGHKKHENHLFMLVWWTFWDCIKLSGGARGRNLKSSVYNAFGGMFRNFSVVGVIL